MKLKFNKYFHKSLKDPSQTIQFLFNLPAIIKLIYRLFRDPRVPVYPKAILVLAAIYVISPIDLIPDVLMPILGQIDDIIIIMAAAKYFLRKCPPNIVEEHVKNIQNQRRSKN